MKSSGSRKELMKNIWMCIILRRRKYNRALRIFGSDTIASAIWHDIQREKALEEQKRKEQVPRKLNDRLQWGREKSQEYNMQQKKNKNKHRERDL